jgi:hypothetical protein
MLHSSSAVSMRPKSCVGSKWIARAGAMRAPYAPSSPGSMSSVIVSAPTAWITASMLSISPSSFSAYTTTRCPTRVQSVSASSAASMGRTVPSASSDSSSSSWGSASRNVSPRAAYFARVVRTLRGRSPRSHAWPLYVSFARLFRARRCSSPDAAGMTSVIHLNWTWRFSSASTNVATPPVVVPPNSASNSGPRQLWRLSRRQLRRHFFDQVTATGR